MNFNLYFKSRQGEMISFLKELVRIESPTSDKKAVDACSAYMIEKFKKIGVKITRAPQKKIGDFTIIEYPSKEDKRLEDQILILTHIDTVWPVGKIEKMPFYVQGEKVFGPGVLDMKAGLVLSYFALKTLSDLNIRPLKKIALFINTAEETGSNEAHEIIKRLAKKSACVLCLEPALPGGGLKVQRKGRLVIRFQAQGKAAHSGNAESGVNAIDELMAQLRKIRMLKSKDVAVNIGLIGGGEKANIVPEHAWAVLDVRFWNMVQKEKIIACLKRLEPSLKGAKIKFSMESVTPPMEKTPASARLLLEVGKIAAGLGITLATGKAGGGSDASIASGLGIATLDGLGPDGAGIHARNEHLLLPSLAQRAALLTELLRQL
jgi:glutamate carboxypeptidase